MLATSINALGTAEAHNLHFTGTSRNIGYFMSHMETRINIQTAPARLHLIYTENRITACKTSQVKNYIILIILSH